METFNLDFIYLYRTVHILSIVRQILIGKFSFVETFEYFSILPESARWMMSKRHYIKAEKLLRQIAKTNKRSFDEEAFEQLKNEQEKVCLLKF
jgi:hypothetical protein